ncbi:MAG: ferrous iron transport protein B [Chloroflexales bacterium]|nr:ferrous iron transport protein B [Chloroflexales bacterium]
MTTADPAYADSPVYVRYEPDLETAITRLSAAMASVQALCAIYRPRWLAIQLLEGDDTLRAEVEQAPGGADVLATLDTLSTDLQAIYGDDVDVALTDQRYQFAHNLVQQVLTRPATQSLTVSDKIDKLVTHRWLGIPIFLALMWVVFKLTTDVAGPYLDWVDGVIGGPLTNWVVALLGIVGLGGAWVESLFVDGIIAGVGGVLVFIPVLMSLYLALALLEDSGYMARAAFVMDRLMRTLGLHGKSFLPMIVGFGCSVPAIYATRTLDNEKDRILTGLLAPFMSCSARLPVYILIAAIFFPVYASSVVFGLYLLGIVVAVLLGVALKWSLFKNKEAAPFIMELPPYRMPTLKGIWFHMWERTSHFVQKAWSIIMITSIVVWFLMATPVRGAGAFADTEIDNSAFGAVAGAIAPVFAPLGFGSWEASGALTTGFIAKEVVVSTLAQTYAVEETEEAAEATTFVADLTSIGASFIAATVDTLKSFPLIIGVNLFDAEAEEEPTALMGALRTSFETASGGHGALAGLAFLVFVLLYTPCMVAVAAARQELGTKWMWFSVVGQFVIAWVAALIVFQGGLLLGIG